MGKYDKAAEGAAAKTNAELRDKMKTITAFSKEDLARVMPAIDLEKAAELMDAVKASTEDNKLDNAYANFAKLATEAGVAVMRKFILGH